MKAYGVKAFTVAMAIVFLIQPVAALTQMQVPFITTDSVIYVQPFQLSDLVITEFNQTNYLENHDADLHISGGPADPHFDPIVVNNSDILQSESPTLPSMDQSTRDSFSYSRTYFFIDVLS